MKICFKCGNEKELTSFYKHAQMGDGHLNKCKDCTKSDSKARQEEKMKDPEWAESEKNRHREKYHRLEYKDKHKPTYEMKKKAMDKYKKKYPEKVLARWAMKGLKSSVKGNELHHWSYRPEHSRDIIELSVKNHNTIHRFIKYDQELMMYRTHWGMLLDTRIQSLLYYEGVLNGEFK